MAPVKRHLPLTGIPLTPFFWSLSYPQSRHHSNPAVDDDRETRCFALIVAVKVVDSLAVADPTTYQYIVTAQGRTRS